MLAIVDIPIDVFDIVLSPQVFGLGVDTGIHLVHRWREEAHEPPRRFWSSFFETARASGICSLTTAMGFESLVACENEGLRSIGWVALIGITSPYVTNILVIVGFILLERRRHPEPVVAVGQAERAW